MPEIDEEIFDCFRCKETVTRFPFEDHKGRKFCSPLHRRQQEAEDKQAIRDREEADSANSVSEPA